MSPSRFSTIKGLILDMDGVLWKGSQPIGNLPDIFLKICQGGFRYVLATNNSTRSVDQYVDDLARMGVHLNENQIINSGEVAANYLLRQFPHGGPVFVVGESGLVNTLVKYGFTPSEKNVLAVVAGLDRSITYEKLKKATLLIRSGTLFIGTNPDKSFPSPEGLIPGAGSILAALEVASGSHPIVMGKPAPTIYQYALDRLGTTPDQTMVIGDRVDTDIIGAQSLGIHTALVLSGVTSIDEGEQWKSSVDIVADDLTSLLGIL